MTSQVIGQVTTRDSIGLQDERTAKFGVWQLLDW